MLLVLFDNSTNLLWCGDTAGYSKSFTPGNSYHWQLFPYTRFKATPGPPIVQHLNHLRGILTLLAESINLNNRRGLNIMALNGDKFHNLSCMTVNLTSAAELTVGGQLLFQINLAKPELTQPLNHPGNLSFVNHLLKFLTLGTQSGAIDIFDPAEGKVVKSFYGHNGILSDIDVQGNYVASCGYSLRSRRGYRASSNDFIVDPLVNIYDLRMMRALPPIPFSSGALFVRFHPKLPNIVVIALTSGHFQFIDIYDQLNVYVYEANLGTNAYLANLDISENGEFITFSDAYANLHLWTLANNQNKNFSNFPSSLDQPDIISQPPLANPVYIDDDVPLSLVGMPYYKDFLLSNYRLDLVFEKELAKAPRKIDPTLVEISDLLGRNQLKFMAYDKAKYGPNTVSRYESRRPFKNHAKLALPKFLSERERTPTPQPPGSPSLYRTSSNTSHADSPDDEFETSVFQSRKDKNQVPNCYKRLEIQYSKFGVQDFDFDYYNKSLGNDKLPGLENQVDNLYINSLLQLYRFSPIFYNAVVACVLPEWLPTDCIDTNPKGLSILNELGYLYDMMYKSHGENVKISNFSQTLNSHPVAKAQHLLNYDELKSVSGYDLHRMVVRFNMFLVEAVARDEAAQFSTNTLQELLNVQYEVEVRSTGCDYQEKQLVNQLSVDLVSPPQGTVYRVNSKKNQTVLTYLEHLLNQSKTLPCNHHAEAAPHSLELKQLLVHVPPLLSLNLPFTSQEFRTIKNFKKWLVLEFYVVLSGGKVAFKPVVTQAGRAEKYELLGYVCEISHDVESTKGQHNVISYIKVFSNELGRDQWYLFNDFLVMPITDDEVFNINYSWKKPTVLLYHNVDHPENQHFNFFTQQFVESCHRLNTSVLYRDHFAKGRREAHQNEYTLLTQQEAPEPGTLVAIDAEFVTLHPDELEISYDGSKHLVKPKNLSLARISVIRGDNGPQQGVPFIDDYILHTGPIYDYLTSFSGIEPGDLDPATSSKNLVTLQTAYRRLWLLLNLGCVFVGHGLKNDFRTINLKVPPAQIRDTIDYYYLPEFKRRLSLKFLAYVLLKERVQTGNHDSIEDAHTALLLYKKYVELKAIGEFDQTLSRIYLEGQSLRFKIPSP